MKTQKAKLMFVVGMLIMTILISSIGVPVTAQEGENSPLGNSDQDNAGCNPVSSQSIINITDANWQTFSRTSDCSAGWGDDEWRLTLSLPKMVRIKVDDCCCPGDYYSILVNGKVIGTTPKPPVWGCDYSGNLSSGYFDILLMSGTHIIKIQNVSFPAHTPYEIAYQRMCPAGFTMTGTLSNPPGITDLTFESNSWEYVNNTPNFLPDRLWISATAKNVGTVAANNVLVRFYLGDPNQGGVQIGSDVNLGSIPVNGKAKATIEWVHAGNVINKPLVAKVFASGDSNSLNDTLSKNINLYYINFRLDTDAYSFENWKLSTSDIVSDLLMFLDVYHPENMLSAIMYPVLYPFWSMILERGGHCFGMSATCSLYYQHSSIKPVQKTTYSMTPAEAQPDIRSYQRTQTPYMFQAAMMDTFGMDVNKEYQQIISSLQANKPPMLLMYSSTANGGHAVTAYKVLDLGDEKRVFVYDNNDPLVQMATSYYATINTKKKTFSYSGYDQVLAREPLLQPHDQAQAFLMEFYTWALQQISAWDHIRVSFGPSVGSLQAAQSDPTVPVAVPASMLITDQYNRRVGYVGGGFVNEIPGAVWSTHGDQAVVDLPPSLQYSVKTTGTGAGSMALSFLLPEDRQTVREVDYLQVPVSNGSTATVQLKRGNSDWTLTNTGQPAKSPDSLIDTKFKTTFLSLISQDTACNKNLVFNPGFEFGQGPGWKINSSSGRQIITTSLLSGTYPHQGSWAAWLGYNNNELSEISTTIYPPSNAVSATLTYYYWIKSSESSCSNDLGWVELNGGIIRLHNLCSSGQTSGWVPVTVDLTGYLGKPIDLKFHVQTNGSVSSSMLIDDVSVVTQCSATE